MLQGPTLTKWYGVLNKYIGSSGSKVALKKVALDQFVFAPGLIAVLLTVFNGLQGLSFDDSIKKLRNDYPDVLVNNYLLWPGVQLVNFWVVPLHYQVLVVQLVALFWNTYMSWKAHTKLVI